MAIAHWVKLNPRAAPVQFRKHERWSLAQWRDALAEDDLLHVQPDANFPKLKPKERKQLRARRPATVLALQSARKAPARMEANERPSGSREAAWLSACDTRGD